MTSVKSENRPKRPAPRTAFKEGKSGNPGGRPAKTEEQKTLEAMCREKTPKALAVIERILEAGQEKNQLTAAIYMMDRGWGKAASTVNLNASIVMMTDEERRARLQELMAKL